MNGPVFGDQSNQSNSPRLEIPLERHRDFSHKAWNFLQGLAASYPNVTVFDPANVLCKANTCQMIFDGQAVLFDADHLTLSAARRVAMKLADELP